MKKLLTAIVMTALLTAGNAPATSAEFPYFGPLNTKDEINAGFANEVQMILNQTQPSLFDTPSAENNSLKASLENLSNTNYQAFFEAPTDLVAEWNTENTIPNDPNSLLGTYCQGSCCVDADCAFNAIGWGLRIECSACGTDVACWARCVKNKDETAFNNAIACTSGNCPQISSLAIPKIFACQKPEKSFIADKNWLILPINFNQDKLVMGHG